MEYYIQFNEEGVLVARYTSEIHGELIPSNAVKVEEVVFWKTINEMDGVWKRDVVTGRISKQPFPPLAPTVPEQVTRAQGKAILIQEGYWEDVETYLEAIEDSKERALTIVALNDTMHWRRDSHTLLMMAEALDISEEELDDLFIKAEKIAL